MVRLVFRPFSQLRKSICTSEARRTSSQDFSGLHPRHEKFTIFRVCPLWLSACFFLVITCLAIGDNSLVRVSRRDVCSSKPPHIPETSTPEVEVWERISDPYISLRVISCSLSAAIPQFLFTFPSRYFFTIAFLFIFRLWWDDPPVISEYNHISLLHCYQKLNFRYHLDCTGTPF